MMMVQLSSENNIRGTNDEGVTMKQCRSYGTKDIFTVV